MPRLLCICGPNGAGKSTFTRTVALRENLLVIDPDKLAADGLTPMAAGKAAVRMARVFLQEGVSFARESTLTAHFDFTLMAEARQRGYQSVFGNFSFYSYKKACGQKKTVRGSKNSRRLSNGTPAI